ncbi:MAG: hypothetical protein AAFR59_08120 [Bacteroidota bacterium]
MGATIGGGMVGTILLGPYMKYIFNSPEIHMTGVNFGLTLAIWDYLWKTDYITHDGRDIQLGFPGLEEYPNSFTSQNLHGLGLTSHEKEHKELRGFMEKQSRV